MQRHWTSIRAIWWFTALFTALSVVSTTIGQSSLATALNENQILYLSSTTGQVIAAIYGLTLTGFIFFRNELSREELEDETLTEAVEALKARYFALLVFITILVLGTVFLANLAIAREAEGPSFGNAVIINVGQSAFLTSLVAIAYFVFDVIAPKRIQKESQRLQDQVDPSRSEHEKGSLEEFLRNYNQIEALLNAAGELYQKATTSSIDRSRSRYMSNMRLAEILLRSHKIDRSLFDQLRELVTLRNSIIHGAEPIVSQQAVRMSAGVLERLRFALRDIGEDQ